MRAAVIRKYGKIGMEEVEEPELKDNNVLIRVKYASICGSDQHILKGEFHPRTTLPLIPGHEFAGVIEALGKNVSNLSPGEKVTVDPIIWCGKCAACKEGHYPACTSLKLVGVDLDGGFAEYVSVPSDMIYKVPSHIPDEHAAIIELISIGFHASARAGLGENDDILIMGSGKVGHAILHAAKTITNGKIFMADILEERLSIASSAFTDIYTINTKTTDPITYIADITEGKGVDIAFEAVGHEVNVKGRFNPIRTCIKAIKGGGKVCVLGLSDHPSEILMKELIWKEARIIASRVSHGEFSKAIEALSSGKLNPAKMITGILQIDDAQKGFELLDNQPEKHLKILLKL
jgi:2-desacetyl-2-hydroxyethyl bacteriochlorophyllide A dehydrogenase